MTMAAKPPASPDASADLALLTPPRVFAQHFRHIARAQQIVGQFNDHLRDTIVLFADERSSPATGRTKAS